MVSPLPETRQALDAFFSPKSVAVIGATENQGSVGRAVLWNLLASPFGGTVLPVNPKRTNVLGIRAYPSVLATPEPPELAVVVTPAPTVPAVILDCAQAGVKAVVVISAGFKEIGARGAELEREIMDAARGKLRIIGPNCVGVMAPWTGLNATFATTVARPGHVGFISQSGALCTGILDWSLKELVGFSAFLSIGSMLDVSWGDLIYHLGDDPRTHSIVIYMETIGDARSFLSAAREVSLVKPIIVIKAGRSEQAAKAAASHTGSLAGSDEVLDAAFRRCGVIRVDRISDLFHMAEALDKQPRPRGPRLAIVTNAGGPGVLATDALIGAGGTLAELAPATVEALNGVLPKHWSHQNPIDLIGDAGPERYAQAVEIVAKDPGIDGLLVILTPQGMTGPGEIAEKLKPYARLEGKPVLASWMGGLEVATGESILNRAGIPTFPYPDTAARVFEYMWRYTYNLNALYETPAAASELPATAREAARRILELARESGRDILTEFESKKLLEAYGIPTVGTLLAATEDDAARAAAELGYPVAVKLHSLTITHKTDVDGVRLNIAGEAGVREAFRGIETAVRERAGEGKFQGVTVQRMSRMQGYEIILGSSIDAQFGPVLLFGSGGQLVEVYRDRALGLPPLNTTLARRMMERTRIYTALKGVRGRKPVDLAALEALIVRFSQLVVEQPLVREIDINPLLAGSEGLLALDARVVLTAPQDPPHRLAIVPYPQQYVKSWTMGGGAAITIRPIRPEDEPLMVRFHEGLSDRSVHFRYFSMMRLSERIAHDRLSRMCFIDYDREMALVAQREGEIIGVGRLNKLADGMRGEFAVVVRDDAQGKGIGVELLSSVVDVGRREGLALIVGYILPENQAMRHVAEKVGFQVRYDDKDALLVAEIAL